MAGSLHGGYVSAIEPMLKIQRSTNEGVVFTLVGRIRVEHVAELQRLLSLEESRLPIALDLQEVTLIDREAIKFLAGCEADSIRLDNCPAYIRAWIDREADGEKKREQ
jgi:anti-anti-sigma regulatory factor